MSFHEDYVSGDTFKRFLSGGIPAIVDSPSESGRLPVGSKSAGGNRRNRTERVAPINAVGDQQSQSGSVFGGRSAMLVVGGLLAAVVLFKVLK